MTAGNRQLKVASYNIHKAVGLDGRRDPERIMAVLREIDADVIALQETDRRFGRRESVIPQGLLDDSPWRAVPLAQRPDSIGWHGNALLVRRALTVTEAGIVPLPTIEPRGAIRADILAHGHRVRVVGMHLDLSGLRRRQQVRAILSHVAACGAPCPAVLMGDMNEWAVHGGSLREFHGHWRVLGCGRSFPSRRPTAQLDRIVVSSEWSECRGAVHHTAMAAVASDHLPVAATLVMPKK